MARRSSLYVLFVLIVPACAPVQREQSPVVPGFSLQVDRPAGPDTILYQRSITHAGQDSVTGTRTVVLQVVRSPGHSDLLQVVQRFPGGGGEIVDTAVAALPTMRAVAHRSHQPTQLPLFIYERGGRVAMPVTVRERTMVTFARLGPRDVWILSVGVPGAPATVWVDTRTHVVLRVRYDIAARALSFTDERVTPIRR